MRPLVLLVLASLGLTVSTPLASACINDRESQRSEKEFKSSYIETPAPSYQPAPPPDNQLLTYGGSGLGAVLLVGACALCLQRVRKD